MFITPESRNLRKTQIKKQNLTKLRKARNLKNKIKTKLTDRNDGRHETFGTKNKTNEVLESTTPGTEPLNKQNNKQIEKLLDPGWSGLLVSNFLKLIVLCCFGVSKVSCLP